MERRHIVHVTGGARFALRTPHAKKQNCLHSYTLKKDAASISEKWQISYQSIRRHRSKALVWGYSLVQTVGSNPAGGVDVCHECCVLSGRGLCVGLITHPEESYRV